jgi:hypothetical protein
VGKNPTPSLERRQLCALSGGRCRFVFKMRLFAPHEEAFSRELDVSRLQLHVGPITTAGANIEIFFAIASDSKDKPQAAVPQRRLCTELSITLSHCHLVP